MKASRRGFLAALAALVTAPWAQWAPACPQCGRIPACKPFRHPDPGNYDELLDVMRFDARQRAFDRAWDHQLSLQRAYYRGRQWK